MEKSSRGLKRVTTHKQINVLELKNVGYVFSKWAKDHFYYEGDEICFSVTG